MTILETKDLKKYYGSGESRTDGFCKGTGRYRHQGHCD